MLLIEQKSGFLTETPDGLVKSYHGKPRNIRTQILRTIEGLVRRFGDEPLSIDYLLYCPDYIVRDPQLAGIDPRHIIDADQQGPAGRRDPRSAAGQRRPATSSKKSRASSATPSACGPTPAP